MLQFTISFLLLAITQANLGAFTDSGFKKPLTNFRFFPNGGFLRRRALKLCAFSDVEYDKCLHTVHTAENSSISLDLECMRENDRESCINLVRRNRADMVILGEHDYQRARSNGLRPIIFGRESGDSLYIAVAPKNIELVELFNAPIDVDTTNDRAFHAAALFNLLRGHDICRMATQEGVSIKIVDSATYTPNDDEILICPNRTVSNFDNYRSCNFEARLQRAVFASSRIRGLQLASFKRVFDVILERFGPQPKNVNDFNFFSEFEEKTNVLFRDDTIAFNLQPTFLNRVDEFTFNKLHCDNVEGEHDEHALE